MIVYIMQNGQIGVIIVIASLFFSVGGGFLFNTKDVTACGTEFDYVTDIAGVKEGDEVVIFSAVRGNTLEDMASVLGTISYEIMTSISSRVKRIYVRE